MLTNLNCNLFFRKILCHRSYVRFLLQEIKRFLQAKKELHHGFWNGDSHYRPGIFLFKVSTRITKNTREKCEINSDTCDIGLRSLMLTFTHSSDLSFVDIEQVNAGSVDELWNGIYFGPEH